MHQIPLFKYWAKELLYAFRDITYKSTYRLQKNLGLKNVYVSDIGIKVYLKKIKFGEQRDNNLDYHMHVESQMLKMYAKLLIEMLTNRDESQSTEPATSQLEKLQIERLASLNSSPISNASCTSVSKLRIRLVKWKRTGIIKR